MKSIKRSDGFVVVQLLIGFSLFIGLFTGIVLAVSFWVDMRNITIQRSTLLTMAAQSIELQYSHDVVAKPYSLSRIALGSGYALASASFCSPAHRVELVLPYAAS